MKNWHYSYDSCIKGKVFFKVVWLCATEYLFEIKINSLDFN